VSDDDVRPSIPPFPGAQSPRAPGNRIEAGLIVAIAVAVLMALGIGGLIAAAVFGDDGPPTGDGLRPDRERRRARNRTSGWRHS